MARSGRKLTKSKKAKSRRGGPRAGAGRPVNVARPIIAVEQQLDERIGKTLSIPRAAAALRAGMLRAAGADGAALKEAGVQPSTTDELFDLAEDVPANVQRSAYRTSVDDAELVEPRPDGGFTFSPKTRHPDPPCKCHRFPVPHQHCARRGCKAMAEAGAYDKWPVEDRLAGYPEPQGWHCPDHREVKKACVGVLGSRCKNKVTADVSARIVRCPGCKKKADVVGGATNAIKPPGKP